MKYSELVGKKFNVRDNAWNTDSTSYTVVEPEIWDKFGMFSREILIPSGYPLLFVVKSHLL